VTAESTQGNLYGKIFDFCDTELKIFCENHEINYSAEKERILDSLKTFYWENMCDSEFQARMTECLRNLFSKARFMDYIIMRNWMPRNR